MKHVTQKELAEILYNVETKIGMPIFASVIQFTEPKAVKKDRVTKEANPYQSIKKLSKVSIILNTDFEKSVHNRLKKEGKDTSEYIKGENTMPIEFGENNIFIGTYQGEFVLQYKPNTQNKARAKYIADGKLIDKKKVENFLPLPSEPKNQGTTTKVLWRKLYLKNLRKLQFNGELYKIID